MSAWQSTASLNLTPMTSGKRKSLSGAPKVVHENVTLFRNIDDGNIGRVLHKYLSQWTTEKVKAECGYVLPKVSVEGASLEDNKVALTLGDGQKIKTDQSLLSVWT